MDAASPDIGPCLKRVLDGDEDAARDLVVHLHPTVMKIVRANRPRRLAEEDVAQEVLARVFERLHRYQVRDGVPFEHWVSRLAVRTCLDAIRAEQRRPEVRFADLGEGGEAWLEYLTVDDAALPAGAEIDARDVLERLLQSLSPEDRMVIRCLDLQEMSVAEVARLTGWSRVAVRVRAFRARARLRHAAVEAREKGFA